MISEGLSSIYTGRVTAVDTDVVATSSNIEFFNDKTHTQFQKQEDALFT